MTTAIRIRNSHAHSRTLLAPLIAFCVALVLLMGGCQSQDGVTGADREGKNTLAVGLAVPLNKFADGLVASGFNTPMAMEFSPDGRLFVLEKGGAVRISQGAAAPLTFLTLSVDQNTERGLLGIAFDPNWASQKYVYIHYSVAGLNYNRVSRFTVSASDPNRADPAETILFNLSPLTNSAYHNGGGLHFGVDGFLYLTTGDNRLPANAQNTGNLLGKILRFGKAPTGTPGLPTLPVDNPYYTSPTNVNGAIWGLGLRNPFTFAVQPGTGRIFINDVGEDGYEEINEATQSGQNFGWPTTEGPTTVGGVTAPIGGYLNGSGVNAADCAITGAAFYNPSAGNQQFPASYLGDYFYGDHCSQYIRSIDLAAPTTGTTFATGLGGNLMDLKVGPDGALYYLTLNGMVGKISYNGTDLPTIARQPVSLTASVDQSAAFSVEANGGGLTYQWQKGGVNIAGATQAVHSIASAQLTDNGSQYRVIVTNPFGTQTSNTVTLSVIANQPPTPVITAPAVGFTTNAGVTLNYSGTATDPEDGVLAATAFTWKVDLVHDTHIHTVQSETPGSMNGSFPITAVNETAPGISYRITLKVRDANGLTTSVERIVNLNKVLIKINTVPSGLRFNLDGQPKTSPFEFTGVVGVLRSLEALSPQTLNSVNYTFASWSNGQPQSHGVSTPNAPTTYTATFATAGGTVTLPGRIQAEDYRTGGQGVGYNDLTPANNQGGQYRPADGVDIEATTDVGGGYNVGWTQAGEWLEFNINVPTAGNYVLTARMASGVAGTKTAAVTVDGAAKGTFSFTDASGWQSWRDVSVAGVSLAAGAHVLRISMTTGDFNINYLNVAASGNLVPVANAGTDKSVAVNALTTLDGRASSDADNAPQALAYAWTQVSGATVILSNANTSQPSFTPAAAGTCVFRLAVNDGAATATDDVQVTVASGPVAITLPGRIQAEDYRTGGQGVGYNDLTPTNNQGAQYRPADGVDIEAATDAGGGYNVGWTQAGEWLEFNVNVPTAGIYVLTARMASGAAGTKTASVTVDGEAKGTFSFTDASGWQSWRDVSVSGVSLSVGAHVLRIAMTTGDFNLNYLNVAAGSGTPGISLPGRIQVEDYKAGGEGVGYHDLTAGNTGNVYKTDNVDIQATTDLGGGYNVGWTDAGEWLAYDVNVATTGTYTFTVRLASGVAGTKTLSLSVDGGAAIPFPFSDASGWQSWKNVIVTGVNLTAGNHVLRLTLPNGGMNINYVEVAAGGSAN